MAVYYALFITPLFTTLCRAARAFVASGRQHRGDRTASSLSALPGARFTWLPGVPPRSVACPCSSPSWRWRGQDRSPLAVVRVMNLVVPVAAIRRAAIAQFGDRLLEVIQRLKA